MTSHRFPGSFALGTVTNARLAQFTAALGQGSSFPATNHSGLASILPLTLRAGSWLRAHVHREATWQGDELIVEMRCFPDLAEAIIETGFLFESNAMMAAAGGSMRLCRHRRMSAGA